MRTKQSLVELAKKIEKVANELETFGIQKEAAQEKLYEYEYEGMKIYMEEKKPQGVRLPAGKAVYTKKYYPVSGALAKELKFDTEGQKDPNDLLEWLTGTPNPRLSDEYKKLKKSSQDEIGKIHVVSVSSEIFEQTYHHGEGSFTGAGLKERVGKTFNSLGDLCKWFHDHYCDSVPVHEIMEQFLDQIENEDGLEHGLHFSSDLKADHTEHQNGGWMEATPKEIDEWKKGNLNLYTEDFWITVITGNHFK